MFIYSVWRIISFSDEGVSIFCAEYSILLFFFFKVCNISRQSFTSLKNAVNFEKPGHLKMQMVEHSLNHVLLNQLEA